MAGTQDVNEVKAYEVIKEFWRDNEHFTDLFNGVVFGGEEVLKPEDFQEMDTDVSGTVRPGDYEHSLRPNCGVLKKMTCGDDFVILGIESQVVTDYAMPERKMVYEGLGYVKEHGTITRLCRKEKELKTLEEVASGLRKEDRFHPIFTIVVSFAEEAWDGPVSLRGMMIDVPEKYEPLYSALFPKIGINLVQVLESEKYQFHNKDVRTVFEVSREFLKGNIEKIRTKYKDVDVDPELIALIGVITGSTSLVRQGEKKEVVNLCTALENLFNEGVEKGREEGRLEERQEYQKRQIVDWTKEGYSREMIAKLLKESEGYVREVQKQTGVLV